MSSAVGPAGAGRERSEGSDGSRRSALWVPARPAGDEDPLLWPLLLFSGILPLLLVGFMTSVLANRLVFLGWALAVAAAFVVVLGRGFAWVWHPARHLGGVALVYAGALGWFGYLVGRHQVAFDEGFRALLWDVYRPWVTNDATWYRAAVVLGALGLILVLIGWLKERRRPVEVAVGIPADSPEIEKQATEVAS